MSHGRENKTAAVALGALLLATLWTGACGRKPAAEAPREAAATPAIPTVAVLGFRNISESEENDWLSTALAELLASHLAEGDLLRLVPGELVAREVSQEEASRPDFDLRADLGQRLGADYLVSGSHLALGDNLSVQVRLVAAARGETVTAFRVNGTGTELMELVSQAGSKLREKLGVEPAPPAPEDPQTP